LSKFPETRNGGILREREKKKLRMATGSVELEARIDKRINGDAGERTNGRM
jgi:hypothetical protein